MHTLFRAAALLSIIFIPTSLLSQTQNSIHFDGVDDFVQTNYQGISNDAPRTVEAWIRTVANANPNEDGVQQIITDWGSFVTGGRFTFNILWDNAIRLEVGGNGVSGTIPVNDNFWHHVAVVYDPTASFEISLYVDGELDTQGNLTVNLNTVLGTNLRFGRRVDNERQFEGRIDEVRVWDYARTQAELQASMNVEFCEIPDGLVAYYTCNHGAWGADNTAVTTVSDYSGFGNDGTLIDFALTGNQSNWSPGCPIAPGITTSSTSEVACDSYTWELNETTYTSSGMYTSNLTGSNGCDSIVTLNLQIMQPQFTETAAQSCEEYYWAELDSYIDASGSYTATLLNQFGCDSTVTLNLTINEATTNATAITACEEYQWGEMLITEPGVYYDTIPGSGGCDSILILDLELTSLDLEINLGLEAQLSASESNADYQWYDCTAEQIVEGANEQVFGAQTSGSYAVILDNGICEPDTSECLDVIVSSIGHYAASALRFYPNPAKDLLSFTGIPDGSLLIQVFTLNGQLILAENVGENRSMNISALAAGAYIIEIRNSLILTTGKLFVKN